MNLGLAGVANETLLHFFYLRSQMVPQFFALSCTVSLETTSRIVFLGQNRVSVLLFYARRRIYSFAFPITVFCGHRNTVSLEPS